MVIEEYNPEWPKKFIILENFYREHLSRIIRVEHVGSTAIIGMCAKPIIDINVVIEKNDFETTKNELIRLGYQHEGDLGIPGREAFKRDKNVSDEVPDRINHHLYVCAKENAELRRQILFRDYLNKHENKKNEYNSIKKEIIKKHGNENRDLYVAAKAADYKWFFEKMIAEAEAEK